MAQPLADPVMTLCELKPRAQVKPEFQTVASGEGSFSADDVHGRRGRHVHVRCRRCGVCNVSRSVLWTCSLGTMTAKDHRSCYVPWGHRRLGRVGEASTTFAFKRTLHCAVGCNDLLFKGIGVHVDRGSASMKCMPSRVMVNLLL